MDRKTILNVLIAIALALTLSGCTASAFPQSTAEEVKPSADQHAASWASDARLVAIAGIEGSWSGQYGDYGFGFDGHEDRAVSDTKTDGRSELWVFRYISLTKQMTYNVVVDANGKLLGSEEDEIEDDDVPLGSYSVESDEAVRIAMDHSQELAESQSRSNHGSVSVLGQDADSGPIWAIVGGAPDSQKGYIGGVVILDARSGQVLFSYDFNDQNWGDWSDWGAEWGGIAA